MALQTSGPISFADIASEFGLSLPVTLSQLAIAAEVSGPPYSMGGFYGRLLSGPFNVGTGTVSALINPAATDQDNPPLADFVTATSVSLANNDSTILYTGGANVYKATLATAGDMTSGTLEQTMTLAGISGINSARFADNGNKVLVCEDGTDSVRLYSVASPYTITSITLLSTLQDATYIQWSGADINREGTRVIVAHNLGRHLVQYNLSTPFDLSTAAFASVYTDANNNNRFRDAMWVPDGTAIITTSDISDDLYKYSLGTAFDVSTINSTPIQLDLTGQLANPISVTANRAGNTVYLKNSGTGQVLVVDVS